MTDVQANSPAKYARDEVIPLVDEDMQEMTDEELATTRLANKWTPESDCINELPSYDDEDDDEAAPSFIEALPSQFTEFAMYMPNFNRKPGESTYLPFSFTGRRHIKRCYDTPSRRLLLVCARQTEKSTLIGNRALCYSCMIPAYRTLYVAPTNTQIKRFSIDRIKEPIETSRVLRKFASRMLSENILEKQFVNRSNILLRNAFLNADRCRGLAVFSIFIDEIQDIVHENIPIIEQAASHAPDKYKSFIYSGTPLSMDNTIEYYRSRYSTQGEWVVPCDCQGGDKGRYWNILGEKNIGIKGLICERCGKLIRPDHPDAQWAFQTAWHPKNAPFESYRINQLMVPWKSWDEILMDYRRYPRNQFYNEVLGISFDSGTRPLTSQQVRNCCIESVHMNDFDQYRCKSMDQPIYCGVDHGTGDHCYTVVSLGTYERNKFRIFYIHRFEGEDLDPTPQTQKIIELIEYFNVRVVGSDYGGGFDRNDALIRKFGPNRIQKYQYVAKGRKKLNWDGRLRRWMVHKTEIMSDIFNAIKRGNVIEFPRWDEFKEPYSQDMLNIFSEYNPQLHMTQYKHGVDKPDDSFHSILYCLLASTLLHPRPDIITPTKEDPSVFMPMESYTQYDQG